MRSLTRRLAVPIGIAAGTLFLLLGQGAPTAAAEGTPAPAAAPEPPSYSRAQELFRSRHFREAIAMLDAFLADHPRDARALVLRGDAKANLTENEAALHDYNTALGIAPEYQYGYVTRCETRLQLDDASGALDDCNTAVRLDASDALAYEDRADVYFDLSRYADALADYNRAVAGGRSSAYVFAARCDANRLTHNTAQATTDCERALTLDPKSRRGLWARARLELSTGNPTAAIGDLNAYIAQKPNDSQTAYYFRAEAFNRLGRYTSALEDLDYYITKEPTDPDGYQQRGIARAGLAQTAAATTDLKTALEGYRKNADEKGVERVTALLKALHDGTPLVAPAP